MQILIIFGIILFLSCFLGDWIKAELGCQRTVCADHSCYCGLPPHLADHPRHPGICALPEASLIQMRPVVGRSSADQVMRQQSGKVLMVWQHRAVHWNVWLKRVLSSLFGCLNYFSGSSSNCKAQMFKMIWIKTYIWITFFNWSCSSQLYEKPLIQWWVH